MVLSASVQVAPLLVAVWVCPPTMTEMVAAPSSTVPARAGVLSAVVRGVTVTVGAAVSMVNSLLVPSVPVLPAMSVARATTL